MKHLRYLLMAALVAMPLTACDEDANTPVDVTPVLITGTVSGTVSIEGTGVAGVSVSLVGATAQTATTASGGGYSFTGVTAGSYGVAISGVPSGAIFATTSATTSVTTQGQTVTVDFSGQYIRTSSIGGQVMAGGMGIAGVSVTATGSEGAKSAVTDNAGSYNFSGLRAGNYTVALSNIPAAYTFATATQTITVGTGEAKLGSFFGTENVVVTEDPVTASVTINAVTAGGTLFPVNPNAVAGQIDVVLNIDAGQNKLSKIELMLDNVVVGSQTLSTAVASEGADQAAGQFQVVFSVNTAAFDAATGLVEWVNKTYALSAKLSLVGAVSASVASSTNLKFLNLDNLIGTVTPVASLVGGTTSSNTGALFYGGGAITAAVLPVIYTGRTINTVTTTFTATGGGTAAIVDAATPFSNAHTAAGYASAAAVGTGNEYITITAATYSDGTAFGAANGGVAIPAATAVPFWPGGIATSGGSTFFVDRAIPTTAALVLLQQVTNDKICCSNNWTNPTYAVAGGYTLAGDNAVGVSIGGVTGQIFAGAATATNTAIAGGTAITTIADAALTTPSTLNTAYALVHVEKDLFGNKTAATRMTALGDNPATTFGIDALAPATQVVTGQATRVINPGAGAFWTFAGTEDRAGFSTDFVRATESRFNTTAPAWPNYGGVAGVALNYPNAPLGLPATNAGMTAAYYTFTAYIIDQAGNAFGTPITRETLVDITAPVAQNVQIPGALVGGALTTFTAPVTDNLDLVTGDFDFEFGAALAVAPTTAFWPFGDPSSTDRVLGVAWDATLTTSETAKATVEFVSSLENNAFGTINQANFVRIGAVDAAQNKSVAQVNNFAAATVTPTAVSFAGAPAMAAFTVATTPATAGAIILCNGQGAACAAGRTKSITVKVATTGPTGTYAPPFNGGFIYLYVQTQGSDLIWNNTNDNVYLVARQGGATGTITDTGVGLGRTYTNTFTITSADVSGIAAGTAIRILAIGVNGSGAGIFSTVDATFTVQNGS